ncbi:hypothetical protein BH11BAC3_BH11BAC3_02900 [soil metagenome]
MIFSKKYNTSIKIIDEIEEYAILFLSIDGSICSWNKGAEKIKGYNAEEIIGQNFKIFYSQEDQQAGTHLRLLNDAKKNGKAKAEGWRIRKDGSKFWGSILITAIHEEDELIGFTKITTDLTLQKHQEESLRRAKDKYHQMIEEVVDYAIILLDIDGNIENWNKGAEKIKGYTAAEIIGKNFRVFYTDEDLKRHLPDKLLDEATRYGRSQQEGWRKRKTGNLFWGSITITALHDDENNLVGFSKVTRDLTEKIFKEKAEKQYKIEVSKNHELEQFVFITSHDLQEPLRSISNFSHLLKKKFSNDLKVEAHTYLDIIVDSTNRMSNLIKCLLDYSRIGINKQLELVNCNTIIENVKLDLSKLIAETNAVISFEALPELQAYPMELYLLFQNLINNAIKYRATGVSPIIKVLAHTMDNGWLFSVEDNGIGIAAADQEKIFHIFQRLHTVEEYTGNGIGLAHCKKITELHNGKIWIESAPGKGSCFKFTIPTN